MAGYRTRVDPKAKRRDYFHRHQGQDGYALPKLFERTSIRALSWLGANEPAYDGRALDAYLELVEARRKAHAAGTGAAAIS